MCVKFVSCVSSVRQVFVKCVTSLVRIYLLRVCRGRPKMSVFSVSRSWRVCFEDGVKFLLTLSILRQVCVSCVKFV